MKSLNANSVILLEKGAVWLGIEEIASNALFVRPCYPEILDAIAAYTLKRPELKKREVIVTGTTGKQIQPTWHVMPCPGHAYSAVTPNLGLYKWIGRVGNPLCCILVQL